MTNLFLEMTKGREGKCLCVIHFIFVSLLFSSVFEIVCFQSISISFVARFFFLFLLPLIESFTLFIDVSLFFGSCIRRIFFFFDILSIRLTIKIRGFDIMFCVTHFAFRFCSLFFPISGMKNLFDFFYIFFFSSLYSDKVKAKEVILRKYDTIILKAAHSHDRGNGSGGSSVIANIALTFGLLSVASIARFVF